MWEELGISGGTAIIVLIVMYYIIKWAVRNGVKEALRGIEKEKSEQSDQSEAVGSLKPECGYSAMCHIPQMNRWGAICINAE